MAITAADVFISYKAEDRARLAPLVAALEAQGLSVWWDAKIGQGADWRREIEEHLEAARCVLVVWSTGAVGPQGHFVRDEATRALRRGTYLPILLDAVEPPLGFGEVQALSMKGWKGSASDPRLAALINALRARIEGGAPSVPWPSDPPRISRRTALAGGAAVGATAIAGGWFLLRPGPAHARRIAVLPFVNLSNDPEQAYFSEGIAEELRLALARVGMEVIGRESSAAEKGLDTKAAAARLKVAHVLTGSVRRSSGLIRISAQLVDGKDGVERWAQTYDRAPGDSIKIQSDIATHVARALSVTIGSAGRAALALGGTGSSLAQDLLLRGRELWITALSEEEFDQALRLTNAAIQQDGNYADAYVQRSLILTSIAENFLGHPEDSKRRLALAEAAAKRAAQIAPKFGAADIALARIAYNRLDIAGLLRHTERALQLAPDDPRVLLDAATTLATLDRGEAGLKIAQRMIALDGLNARAHARMSLVLLLLRRYPEAIAAVDRANSIAPGNPARHGTAGDSWMLMGEIDKARAEYAKMPEDDYLRITGEAIAAARSGDRAAAARGIARLRELYGSDTTYQYAAIYAQLGDRDKAFAELDKAFAVRDPGLVGIKTDAFLDPLRSDRRYRQLVARLGFP
ncbi:TIR domain-containing protein [Sphingomonas sp. HDW15A]|uniref:TIR domain-containing protein n=1 Tax=Sphingomonas sp. HDW15A TaxID=2714942 RepID=UPI00140BBCBF|nr:TIR domain-containing protein [Sphingomonas sp. HDW15A]QIK95093.1 TIR domain-containing protein [Sphingomonas sp. HDW15A]